MNVIWFVIDTLRSDHLSCYGYFRETSPNIDRLAKEGILFEDSYASAIATGPAFTSLFTGLAAIHHRFYLTPWNRPNAPLLDDRITTLPEIIQARGDYTTAAFDNLINFRAHMKQFVRGFEFYINITRSPAWLHHHVIAQEVDRRLLPWLARHADEPFFAFVHYWDPHLPYNMPKHYQIFDRKHGDLVVKTAPDGYKYVPGWGLADALPEEPPLRTIDFYDDEIRYVDASIGAVRHLLEELDLLDDTVLIVTGDHGEDLNLHGMWGHGFIYETTVRVPLIIRDPRCMLAGHRVSGFVQHADNLPTILDYFPAQERPDFSRIQMPDYMPDIPDRFDGQNLLALARGERNAPGEIVVESLLRRAYLAPPWKLIWHRDGTPSELYHLENDPLELNDRAQDRPDMRRELEEKLEAWVHAQIGDAADPIYDQNEPKLVDRSLR